MGRMRTMKPEFFKSRSLAKVPREVRLMFAGMWTEADDHGNGVADPRLLKAALFPLDDDVEPEHVSAFLRMLVASSHISLYAVGEETYFHIINFTKHQAAAYRRGEPKYPGVAAGQKVELDPACEGVQESAARTPKSAVTGNREQVTGNEEKDLATAAAPAVPVPDLFDAFWSNYPRKANKQQAKKAWPKACKKLSPERLVKAAAYWAGQWETAGVETQHIPHASTFLNNERWNDEPPRSRTTPAASPTDAFAQQFLAAGRQPTQPPLRALPGGAS
ncbi:hypothetical protein [Amycolatopsis speibonae]|uniref:Uncharacterized protein n=1 Tax=Amycolatopsis speibonae TaxID=1450224 RepID=A0ABV7P4M7_9PSEU